MLALQCPVRLLELRDLAPVRGVGAHNVRVQGRDAMISLRGARQVQAARTVGEGQAARNWKAAGPCPDLGHPPART